MAKIHKGIATGSGFAYKGKDLNFSRDVYDNFADLLYDASTYGFPDGFKTVVKNPTDNPNFGVDAYRWGTFIYTNSEWRLASYVDLDTYLSFANNDSEIKINNITGISGVTKIAGDKIAFSTNGGIIDLNNYALKSDVTTDLGNYVTNSALNTTLGSYAKLVDADFKSLTLNGTTVATTKSVSDALVGYAKLNDSANFSALTVENNSVATKDWTTQQIGAATTQALTYKGGIAKQSDITDAEATGTIKVGNVYVCTTENNYTLNGGTVRLEAGDTLICKSITGTEKWNIVQANITGAVTKSSDLASGQLVVGTGLSSVKALDAGENGKFLKVENSVLTWGDIPVYGLNNGSPTTNGLVPYDGSAKSGTFLRIDGTWEKPHDTTYNDATITTHGLMTADDKVKLNGIEAEANKYVLHVATDSSLGGIKIGYTENAGEKKYKVQVSSDGKAFVYVPWTDTNTTYDDMAGATASSAGASGLVPAPTAGQQGLFLCGNGTWAKPTDTVYALKAATSGDLGGIKIGYNPTIGSKKYAVELDDEKAFVTVPWIDTTYEKFKPATDGLVPAPGADNTTKFLRGDGSWVMPVDTVYTAGTGISIDNKVIKNTGVISVTIDPESADTLLVNGKAITINDVTNASNAAHANTADSATTATTATKVSSVLEIENYNPTGELIVSSTYNGQNKVTINCITVEDINGLFPS